MHWLQPRARALVQELAQTRWKVAVRKMRHQQPPDNPLSPKASRQPVRVAFTLQTVHKICPTVGTAVTMPAPLVLAFVQQLKGWVSQC